MKDFRIILKTQVNIQYRLHILLTFLVFNFSLLIKSQTFPVSITTQLSPPFSGYLPDYATAGNDKLKLLVLFNDFSKPSYNVKLKIKIDGQGITIQSKPFYFDGPFTLEPGVPTMLEGFDFAGLLNSNNLDFSGITKTQYEQRKVLPEGFYSICVTAYDYTNPNNIIVSNVSCAYAMMILSDPPYLNLPSCGSNLQIVNPQQITFNWTPINQGSPNSNNQTDYVLELFEVRPPNANPNNIVQTLPPIFTETTSLTTFNYGITEPPLINAMQYVWRVRAVDQSGRDLFKNNGYSQICTFTWGSAYTGANLNINLTGVPLSHRQIKCNWDSLNLYQNYKLEFKKVNGTANWFPVNTPNARARISSLEPNTDYNVKVSGELPDNSWGPSSNVITVHTPAAPVYNCGEMPMPFNPQTFVPLTVGTVGMIWEIGQFEVLVTGLDNTASANGMYCGKGRVLMGFAGALNFPVTFTNVVVNKDLEIVAGKVNVRSKGIDAWLNQNNVGFFIPGNESTEYTSGSTNPNINVNQNNGTMNVGGQTMPFNQTYGNTIKDGSGNLIIVAPNGSTVNVGSTNGSPIAANKKYINSGVGTVTYKEHAQQFYGFDPYQFSAWENWYEKVLDVATKSNISVDWKSIQAKKYDVVELQIQLTAANLKADSVFIKSSTGTIFKQQHLAGKNFFYIIGSEEHKSQELFACIKMGDSIVNIGKLNTINYALKEKVLNIVPLNNSATLNAASIQARLNRVYRQALTTWKVNIKPTFTVQTADWDIDHNAHLNCGSGLFTKYSKEMIKLNAALRKQTYYNDQEFFAICTGTQPDSLNNFILGEMPRGRNIGYAFTNANTNDSILSKILVHELGHGAGTLEHTFPALTQGSTRNLMDYVLENKTARWQWDLIQEPNGLAGVFDKDEDGMFNVEDMKKDVYEWLAKIRGCYKQNKTFEIAKDYYLNDYVTNITLNGISYDFIKITGKFVSAIQIVSPKNKIIDGISQHYTAYNNSTQNIPCIDVDGGKLKIEVPPNRIANMKNYLQSTLSSRNILLFVNGYRTTAPSVIENVMSENEIYNGDPFGYWEGIDADFINRIGTKNVFYADGHHSVATSNLLTQNNFLLQMEKSIAAKECWVTVPGCCQNEGCVTLSTVPNTTGFNIRKNHGKLAAVKLLAKLNSGDVPCQKDGSGKIIDTLDIVAHSMGFAYAQGMIEELKGKIQFGRYYIIAPENACTGTVETDGTWNEIWQYGTNEKLEKNYNQDGIAAQCAVNGIEALPNNKTIGGRVYIPTNEPKGFRVSHIIENYKWILIKTPSERGYVKKRN